MKRMGLPNSGSKNRVRVWVPFTVALVLGFAICPNTASSAALSTDLPSLAIFPFYLPGVTEAHAPLFMDALYDVLDGSRKFVPKYSWYSGDDRYKPDSLRQYKDSDDSLSRVWKQEGSDPKKGPDRDIVFRIGGQLGVDAVILYGFHVSGYGNDIVRGYLFDVVRKRVFVAERNGKMVYVFTGEILESALDEWIQDITRQLFRMED